MTLQFITIIRNPRSSVHSAGIRKVVCMQRENLRSEKAFVKGNKRDANEWDLNNLECILYLWVDYFNLKFFKDQPVPKPFITFERTTVTNFGQYVPKRNAFGVKENININKAHLNRPLWGILSTLLHEMVHSWQALYGKPSKSWFHNKEFHGKMAQFGILCNGKGLHTGICGPFVSLLKERGVKLDYNYQSEGIIKIPSIPKPKGKSKLKKWSCGCTNIRVAVIDLQARCLKCGELFKLIS